MRGLNFARASVAVMVVGGGMAIAAPVGGPPLAAIARIEPGQWQIKTIGSPLPPRALCIGNATILIQYGHDTVQCRHMVITDTPDVATVHYACPGAGHGRTTFKVATPRAFNLETQGILNGAPFEEAYEAHRVGDCAAGAPPPR